MSKLSITYEVIAQELGATRRQLQSFVKRCQLKDPDRFRHDGWTLNGKAMTHAFTRRTADGIKRAWTSEGPGRKKAGE